MKNVYTLFFNNFITLHITRKIRIFIGVWNIFKGTVY